MWGGSLYGYGEDFQPQFHEAACSTIVLLPQLWPRGIGFRYFTDVQTRVSSLFCVHSADSEGVHVTVDVGECVNICEGWVSGFAGMKVHIGVL